MTERETNHRIAAIYFVIAALLFISSIFFFYQSGKQEVSTHEQAATQCQIQLKSLGFESTVSKDDRKISVRQAEALALSDKVKNASIAISRCAGYQLQTFCAGSGCPAPGIQLTLRPVQ